MAKHCAAYATSTGDRCRNRALPGSPYCRIHIQKLPLLISAVLGAIISAVVGLIVIESYRSIVPSEELKELRAASEELKELQTMVQPVVDLATARFPNVNPSEALALLVDRVANLEEQMANVEDERVTNQAKRKQYELLRRTAPEVDVQLERSSKGEYTVVIHAKNRVPFFARWLVATKENHVVSGVMMGDMKLHPTPDQSTWKYRTTIDINEVKDNFVELRFRYKSVFYAEMGNPKYLKGEAIHAYDLIGGVPYPRESR